MKRRKINKDESARETLCQFVLKEYKNTAGKFYGFELCEHKAKWKAGRTYFCGWHVPKSK